MPKQGGGRLSGAAPDARPAPPVTVTTIDAFADRPFSGNPAAVCVLDRPARDAWMQALAAEMNLSETAFVTPGGAGATAPFGLRWFTPTVEVDLCGHATLAAAHLLYESGRLGADDEAQFDTRSGRLTVRQTRAGRYALDFPATPPEAAAPPDGFAEALGAEPVWAGRSRFDWFAVLESEAAVRALDPSAADVAALGLRGVIATARAASDGVDVVSRFFAPNAGVVEDPVTGSAHCAIGPYWAGALGTDRLACYQASARGGAVDVRVRGDRVVLEGGAVTVYRAELAPSAHPAP